MIVIGVGAHKRTHSLAAIDSVSGALIAQRTVPATDEGVLQALRFAAGLGPERVWALEDCRHVVARFERGLVAAGEGVLRVPPAMTVDARRAERQPGKSDAIDATAAARAVVREGLERFPIAFLDERAMEIRQLQDYRDQLISERVRMVNRLRWHLVALDPEREAKIRPAGFDSRELRTQVRRRLKRLSDGVQVRIARDMLARIDELFTADLELQAQLAELVQEHCPQLLAEHGCGTVTAAIIIGHTAGAGRFPTDACFARHTGTAPIPASSGNTTRHRLHRGGDRQLNRAIHIMALCRARNDPATRAYLQRKHAEGKTKREALRCLKRHLARHIWHILYTIQTTPQPQPAKSTHGIKGTAPALMPCTR
ncbi:MAG: IS110 family transposase [Bacteroidales bacterium]